MAPISRAMPTGEHIRYLNGVYRKVCSGVGGSGIRSAPTTTICGPPPTSLRHVACTAVDHPAIR